MQIIGHRGAKGLEPENTLRSFLKALDHHVDQLEFDLRVTRDNEVVIHHDPDVVDPAGNRLSIKAHTLAELRSHKPDLCTFEELLAAVDPAVHLLVEIKPHEPTRHIIAIIRKQRKTWRAAKSFSIGSFDQAILRTMHAEFPDIEMVVIERWSAVRAQWRAHQVGTKRLSMNERWLWSGVLAGLYHGGYLITPYTLNDPRKARRWQKYLYGVITDFPDRFERT